MLNEALSKKCLEENKRISKEGLAKLTWGNFSLIDRKNGLIYIKPSGANLEKIKHNDISILDLDGNKISGLKQSIDTNIHLQLYKNIDNICSICHTHSPYATAFAQAKKKIDVFGTTHADTFAAPIRVLDPDISIYSSIDNHEKLLGEFIANAITPEDSNGILVSHHGPFTWSNDFNAVDVAIALEEISKIAFLTSFIGICNPIPKQIQEFHWDRKHGRNKRYGQ